MTALQRSLNRRDASWSAGTAMQAQYTIVTGSIELRGEGEGVLDVRFPVRFVEVGGAPPQLVGSGSVGASQTIEEGRFPSWNVGVLRWDIKDRQDASPLYLGATLIVRCSGVERSTATWFCMGTALTAPGVSDV